MDLTFSHESCCPGCENDSIGRSYVDHLGFYRYPHDYTYNAAAPVPNVALPTPGLTVWNVQSALRQTPAPLPTTPPIVSTSSHATSIRPSHVDIPPMWLHPAQPQPTGLLYMDTAARASDQNTASRSEYGEIPPIRNDPTSREFVPQKVYKPLRRQQNPGDPQTIEFFVSGERGICLSYALEKKWDGFEGRDDTTLFGDIRIQIMLRMQVVGCPPWQSKISTTDHTAKRHPITRKKLASEVAKSVKRFLEREKAEGHSDYSRCKWQDVLLSDMYLTRLVRVSAGSWQPEIFVAQPSVSGNTSAAVPMIPFYLGRYPVNLAPTVVRQGHGYR